MALDWGPLTSNIENLGGMAERKRARQRETLMGGLASLGRLGEVRGERKHEKALQTERLTHEKARTLAELESREDIAAWERNLARELSAADNKAAFERLEKEWEERGEIGQAERDARKAEFDEENRIQQEQWHLSFDEQKRQFGLGMKQELDMHVGRLKNAIAVAGISAGATAKDLVDLYGKILESIIRFKGEEWSDPDTGFFSFKMVDKEEMRQQFRARIADMTEKEQDVIMKILEVSMGGWKEAPVDEAGEPVTTGISPDRTLGGLQTGLVRGAIKGAGGVAKKAWDVMPKGVSEYLGQTMGIDVAAEELGLDKDYNLLEAFQIPEGRERDNYQALQRIAAAPEEYGISEDDLILINDMIAKLKSPLNRRKVIDRAEALVNRIMEAMPRTAPDQSARGGVRY